MIAISSNARRAEANTEINPSAILNLLSDAVVAVGEENEIRYVNYAAEHVFGVDAHTLLERSLEDFVSSDNSLFFMIEKSRSEGTSYAERNLRLEGPRVPERNVSVQAQPGLSHW